MYAYLFLVNNVNIHLQMYRNKIIRPTGIESKKHTESPKKSDVFFLKFKQLLILAVLSFNFSESLSAVLSLHFYSDSSIRSFKMARTSLGKCDKSILPSLNGNCRKGCSFFVSIAPS